MRSRCRPSERSRSRGTTGACPAACRRTWPALRLPGDRGPGRSAGCRRRRPGSSRESGGCARH
ncbi:TPA: hypothetical protein L5597_005511 [Pseudomonas aeruginosa]|nr:hypothetical protein [Pseudomonas aeruginosa]MDV6556492.1 hypothetical protein [Pseudomonas aeruginosa]MDV6636556.1 hypothetical protein [Pseudomonas aeruginosa]MDV6658050.1 hypothetical protein [Pseudomonas aeruginosa]MDV6683420.1 hypothetical protein [Pseudomonas aeruginosa]